VPFRDIFRKKGKPAEEQVDWLIVGLGNPGSDYSHSRHNLGFWTVNRLGREIGAEPRKGSGSAAIGVGELEGHRVALLKPRTGMNRSGDAIAQMLQRYRLQPARLVVVYDDLDLKPAQLRIRFGGGHGGNNGLRSVVARAGRDFYRVRIGIGRPTDFDGKPTWDPNAVASYVLSDPPSAEGEALEDAVKRAAEAVHCLLRDGLEAAQQRFNG
jgi:PTH1 family peptidyl-tRNA hydrolase